MTEELLEETLKDNVKMLPYNPYKDIYTEMENLYELISTKFDDFIKHFVKVRTHIADIGD